MSLFKSKAVAATTGVLGTGSVVAAGGVFLLDGTQPSQEASSDTVEITGSDTTGQASGTITDASSGSEVTEQAGTGTSQKQWWRRGSDTSTTLETLKERLTGFGDFLKEITNSN